MQNHSRYLADDTSKFTRHCRYFEVDEGQMPKLAHTILHPARGSAQRYLLFLHGIMGTQANWRGISKRVINNVDGWGAVLVDLREHGNSKGFSSPHTVQSAAEDLLSLADELPSPILGALGHSFGGKVALAWADTVKEAERVIVVDASPSPRPDMNDAGSVLSVIDSLTSMPRVFESRDQFVEMVVRAGHPEATANWLAMNLDRDDEGKRVFGIDLDVIRQMLTDYAERDLWSVLESPRESLRISMIVGARSNVVSSEDQTRLQALAKRGQVNLTILNAGHWIHVDAPHALIDTVTDFLSG